MIRSIRPSSGPSVVLATRLVIEMKFLRNPEVRRILLLEMLLSALMIFIGFRSGSEAGYLLMLLSGLLILMNLFFTFRRYRNIARLTEEMDDVLHKEQFSPIS